MMSNTILISNFLTGGQVEIKYTPYDQLQEGDEFIKLTSRWVLLSDMRGVRDGGMFTPDFTTNSYQIHRLVADGEGGTHMEFAS
jgi:hypothetical protein